MRHLVVDVQVVMIGSGLSDPPDDGSCHELLKMLRDGPDSRLVWDSGGLIQNQYEAKLKPQTFGKDWLTDMLIRNKVTSVARKPLTKRQKVKVRETGLVGEDLNYYVRTAMSSPDERLVSLDSDYDASTCRTLRKELGVTVSDARDGAAFLSS